SCPFCSAKRASQRDQLEKLRVAFPSLPLTFIPLFPFEVKGEDRLSLLAEAMREGFHFSEEKIGPPPKALEIAPVTISRPRPEVRILLFGGKGGVGKTSLACAFALQLSLLYPEKKILLFSTDPAHSLADSLGQEVGDTPRVVDGRENLFALEMDPEERFEQFKRAYAGEVREIFEGLTRHSQLEVPFDQEVLTRLLDLTPPGLDEIMILLEILNLMKTGEYDLYILDTAPTGHLLRFLELPDLMQEWLRTFFEMILKYRSVTGLPKTSALLVQMSKDLKEIRKHLSDPERCEFIPVAIPTVMAFKETRRLLLGLDKLSIPYRRLMLNLVVPSSSECEKCSALRVAEEEVISLFREEFPSLEIVTLLSLFQELRGIKTLSRLFQFSD
ncbi:MAG: TRC40/GET3/ArsA family transport-energizing ATPase, partial [Candidatus Tectomicrobia bacterium]|nr:TRC40/GET3/ArsA family transport-energizing ATPase [Candidatus Tectomicrobia bacterium]